MDIQTKIINKIGVDKLLHLSYGGWSSGYGQEWWQCILIAFSIGLLKELVDKFYRKTEFSIADLLWTTSGGVINAILKL